MREIGGRFAGDRQRRWANRTVDVDGLHAEVGSRRRTLKPRATCSSTTVYSSRSSGVFAMTVSCPAHEKPSVAPGKVTASYSHRYDSSTWDAELLLLLLWEGDRIVLLTVNDASSCGSLGG